MSPLSPSCNDHHSLHTWQWWWVQHNHSTLSHQPWPLHFHSHIDHHSMQAIMTTNRFLFVHNTIHVYCSSKLKNIWQIKNIVGIRFRECFLTYFTSLNPDLALVWHKKLTLTHKQIGWLCVSTTVVRSSSWHLWATFTCTVKITVFGSKHCQFSPSPTYFATYCPLYRLFSAVQTYNA